MEYLCIILFTILAWWRVINAGLVIDDSTPEKRYGNVYLAVQSFLCLEIREFMRHFKNIFYGTDMFKNVRGDHIASLCVHALVSCLIYLCLGQDRVAFISSLLFGISPITNQVSCWCNGKRYGVATALSLLLYALAPVGILLYIFIPFVHASALLAPLLFLYKGQWMEVFLAISLGCVGFPFMRRWYFARKKTIGYKQFYKPEWRKLILCVKRFNFFFWHTIMPKSCGMYLGYQFYYGLTKSATKEALAINREFWLSLCTLLSVLTTMIYMWHTPVGFGLAWFCLFTAQWCGMIIVTQSIVERTMYLPAIGLCLAMGYVISIFPILFIPIATIYVLKSWDVTKQYGSIPDMLDYNIQNNPDSPHCYIAYITDYFDRKMIDEGYYWAKKAAEVFPEDVYINLLLSAALVGLDEIEQANLWLLRSRCVKNKIGFMKPSVKGQVSREQYLEAAVAQAIKNRSK